MKLSGTRIGILSIGLAALFVILVFAAHSMVSEPLGMWVAKLYNQLGPYICPNQVTAVLFDWRGFDTIGECMVLGTAVMVAALLFGRGALQLHHAAPTEPEPAEDEEVNKPHSSVILRLFGYPIIIVLVAYSITIVLGGHLSPGGGFQAGAIVASACLLGVVIYGLRRRPFGLSISAFHKFETVGILIFLLLGLVGLIVTGYYLFNLGANLPYLTQTEFSTSSLFNYPAPADAPYQGPGIIPYLNIGVFLKVLGSLSIVVLILVGARKR